MCVESVCVRARKCVYVCACVLFCDELLSHGSPLHAVGDGGAVRVTLYYCFPNTPESMWDRCNSARQDEFARASLATTEYDISYV